jgi:hypothetical protein
MKHAVWIAIAIGMLASAGVVAAGGTGFFPVAPAEAASADASWTDALAAPRPRATEVLGDERL